MVLINLHSKNGWSFINHLILPKPDPFDVQNIHVKPQFSAQFSCDSLEINPASTFYVIHHQNLIKIANKNVMQLSASVGAN